MRDSDPSCMQRVSIHLGGQSVRIRFVVVDVKTRRLVAQYGAEGTVVV